MAHSRILRLAVGAPILVALATVACRHFEQNLALDSRMASCLPPDAVAIAGADLARLRSSPAFHSLGPSATASLALQDARYLLLAYNGKELLAITRGDFKDAPAGAVLVAKDIAVSGSPDAVRAASAQFKTGQPGARWLLDRAGAATSRVLWAVAQGGAKLPLAGNAANWNKLLSLTEYATLSAQLDSDANVEAQASGATEAEARQFEETLRATFTLAAMGLAKDPALARALRSVQVRRDGRAVHAALTLTAEQLNHLIGAIAQ